MATIHHFIKHKTIYVQHSSDAMQEFNAKSDHYAAPRK